MSEEFQEVQDLEAGDTSTTGTEDSLFDELEENSDTGVQAETDVDPAKVRREQLKQGKEQLMEIDFKNSAGDWKENGEILFNQYQRKIENEKEDLVAIGGDSEFEESQLQIFCKSLVVGGGAKFKGFLPGGTGGIRTTKESQPSFYIPELEKFRELVNAVNKATKEWAKNSPEVAALMLYTETNLEPTNEDGTRATFDKPKRGSKGEETETAELGKLLVQPYIINKNDWTPWIKENFEETKRETESD